MKVIEKTVITIEDIAICEDSTGATVLDFHKVMRSDWHNTDHAPRRIDQHNMRHLFVAISPTTYCQAIQRDLQRPSLENALNPWHIDEPLHLGLLTFMVNHRDQLLQIDDLWTAGATTEAIGPKLVRSAIVTYAKQGWRIKGRSSYLTGESEDFNFVFTGSDSALMEQIHPHLWPE